MRRLLLAVALAAPLAAAAQPADWGATDTALLGAALGSVAVDWGQTRYISRWLTTHPDCRCWEANPLLGRQPSLGRVNTYFALAAVSTVGLALVLPRSYRRVFLGVVTTAEVAVVVRNHSLGVQVAF